MKKIIIFGGSGFIGSHLIKELLVSKEEIKVVSVDIVEPKTRLSGVDYVNADVRELNDFEVEGEILRIYNFAAVHTTPGHPNHEYYETNVLGALEVTKFAEKHGVNEIVFTSSISVYGPGEDRKYESSKLTPTSAYGYSKMLAEKIHKAWNVRNKQSRLIIVRPAVVFGAREGGNFTRLASLLKKGMFVYPGRKDTIKACIYVGDLLYSIEHARQKGENFILFNGCYKHRYTLEEIVNEFTKVYFPSVKTVMLPKAVVLISASILRVFNFMNLGIHPERILKLVQSTDVYPEWLVAEGLTFNDGLKDALRKWSDESHGEFK